MEIGILGYGTVGRSVYRLLQKVEGAHVKYVLEQPDRLTEAFMTSDADLIFEDPSVELIVDALPGIHPSYEYIKRGLQSGKHVVSSNKAAICYGFSELSELAMKKGVSLLYEASCGGGIPIIEEILRVGALDQLDRVSGILNGTSNYMLWQMESSGMSYDEALHKAQELGYAEADPTADVSGFDVRNKIIILSSLAFDTYVEKDIPVMGIERIGKELMEELQKQGKSIKLMGIAVREAKRYALAVTPVVLDRRSLEANVSENFNMISINGEFIGELKFYGQGAGGDPTADAVVRDIEKVLFSDSTRYQRSFKNSLSYDPGLLCGRCYIGDQVFEDMRLSEGMERAKSEDKFFAFEL